MEKQATSEMDYERIVEDIIHVMMRYGATHDDADEIMHRFRKAIKCQKIKMDE